MDCGRSWHKTLPGCCLAARALIGWKEPVKPVDVRHRRPQRPGGPAAASGTTDRDSYKNSVLLSPQCFMWQLESEENVLAQNHNLCFFFFFLKRIKLHMETDWMSSIVQSAGLLNTFNKKEDQKPRSRRRPVNIWTPKFTCCFFSCSRTVGLQFYAYNSQKAVLWWSWCKQVTPSSFFSKPACQWFSYLSVMQGIQILY